MSEHAAIRKVAEAAVRASESAMVNPHRIIQLLDTIESTESQLSQALRELGEARQTIRGLQETERGHAMKVITLAAARDAALRSTAEPRGALELLELAEDKHANCPECEGEGIPELCPVCFPYFDSARVARRTALASSNTPCP